MKNAKVKNIIFDLGGVLLNINYKASIEAFKAIGIRDFEKLYTQAQQSSLFDDFEVGRISPAEFRDGLRVQSGVAMPDQEIDDAWNAMLLDFPKKRLDFLKQMSVQYRCFLLSNTNDIHIESFERQMESDGILNDFQNVFEGHYYSSSIGKRKPNPDTFLWVCEQHQLVPEDTLFIDDSIQHVHGAKEADLQAHFLDTSKEDVIQLLGRVLA